MFMIQPIFFTKGCLKIRCLAELGTLLFIFIIKGKELHEISLANANIITLHLIGLHLFVMKLRVWSIIQFHMFAIKGRKCNITLVVDHSICAAFIDFVYNEGS